MNALGARTNCLRRRPRRDRLPRQPRHQRPHPPRTRQTETPVRLHEFLERLDVSGSEPGDSTLVTLGRTIRGARRAREMSQEALGCAAGLAAKHVSEIERGNRDVRFTTLVRVAKGLGVSVGGLLSIYDLERTANN